MMHRLSNELATYCINRRWIDECNHSWCRYAIEKKLGLFLFLVLLFIGAIITTCFIESYTFAIVFYIFRKNMGGWHAKKAWSCQIIGFAIVIIAVRWIGPALEIVNISVIYIFDLALIGYSFILKPAYPAQLHFTQNEVKANIKKKNKILLVLLLFQNVALLILGPLILIYSFIGLTIAVISVIIEKLHKKEERIL